MITILTPTYNRADKLGKLYDSLTIQTSKEFVWLIVDDGSSDGTEDIVNNFKKDADFQINYKKKSNGGKHTALNFAYQFICTEWVFIVDSDDELTPDAVKTILETADRYGVEPDVCGYSFMRQNREGGFLSKGRLPKEGTKTDFVTCRLNGNMPGDMAEVWKTSCLKEYLFPEFSGEKFLGEDLVWIRMAGKYKMRFFSKPIYISGYLDDGLTRNRREHNIQSPNGCVERAKCFLESDAKLTIKIKAMLQYIVYSKFAGRRLIEQLYKIKKRGLFILCLPVATLLYVRWKGKY